MFGDKTFLQLGKNCFLCNLWLRREIQNQADVLEIWVSSITTTYLNWGGPMPMQSDSQFWRLSTQDSLNTASWAVSGLSPLSWLLWWNIRLATSLSSIPSRLNLFFISSKFFLARKNSSLNPQSLWTKCGMTKGSYNLLMKLLLAATDWMSTCVGRDEENMLVVTAAEYTVMFFQECKVTSWLLDI